ncbi:PAS domain-containing hybrid sensor histidine kinase/response regulator [Indioceanicola profundi]|uniref:PAS domain-containing hybrid sensor histidine kinase/response regulator n=1 Tax=Indioceanicola profundi TaxID=2220096 RepID=UPI0013C4A238|nr:ATP-binding protein [Indioceanicola profundi]
MLSTRHPVHVFWGAEHICFYNDGFAASLGPEKHPAILGAPGQDAWPEIWPIIGPQIDQVMAGGEPTWHENQLVSIVRHGKQDEVYWTYSYGPIADPDAPDGVGGVLVIISETTKAVLARHEQDLRLRATQANVGVGIQEVDAEGHYLFINETFTRVTGYVLADFDGRTFFDSIEGEDDRVQAHDNFARLIRGEVDSYAEERPYTSKGGRRWWAEVRVTAVRDGHGRFLHAIRAVQDVTARREAEEALKAARDEAERARTVAEDANRAKSRFLAAASHDLRQPAMAAGLYLGLLESRVQDPDLRGLVEMASLSLEGLRGMLNGLLETARFEAGVVQPKLEAFALQGLLHRLGVEFEGPARAARLSLRVPPTTVTVRSDRLLLELILRNLISNAVKYTESGEVAVACVREEGWVRIDVTDTGPGIRPEHLERIFDDFAQLGEESRSTGFGLGLSTARRAAAVLEHKLEVRSSPGCGSTFSVWVPEGRETAPPPLPRCQERALAAHKVLIVEDDRMVAAALSMTLEDWGLEATVAHSVADARKELARERFGVVISDFQLPDGDGFDAIEAARAAGSASVLLTGDTRPRTLRRAHEAGLRLLTKPVDVWALRETVLALTDERAATKPDRR